VEDFGTRCRDLPTLRRWSGRSRDVIYPPSCWQIRLLGSREVTLRPTEKRWRIGGGTVEGGHASRWRNGGGSEGWLEQGTPCRSGRDRHAGPRCACLKAAAPAARCTTALDSKPRLGYDSSCDNLTFR